MKTLDSDRGSSKIWPWLRARRTSGPEQTGPEGHGGQPPRVLGDRTRYYTNRITESSPRRQSLSGRPRRINASPRSEQSSHRNALYPTKWVSPRQRAGSRSGYTPCVLVQMASAQRERQAGYQTEQYQGLIAGRAVGPAWVGDAQGNGRRPWRLHRPDGETRGSDGELSMVWRVHVRGAAGGPF